MAPKRPRKTKEDVDYAADQLSDDEFEAPKPKKKAASKSKGRAKAKAPKPKKLELFQEAPLDVLVLIASSLDTSTLLSLSRTCRVFRNLCHDSSSKGIWAAARANTLGQLPALTATDLLEWEYASLIYDRTCHGCGKSRAITVDYTLRLRGCADCMRRLSLRRERISTPVHYLVWSCIPYSTWNEYRFYHLNTVTRISHALESLASDSTVEGKAAFDAYIAERKDLVKAARIDGQAIRVWEYQAKQAQAVLDKEASASRREKIIAKLEELGYTQEDFREPEFTTHSLVNQPKDLTDRIWSNVKSKLSAVLDECRVARAKRQLEQRRDARQIALLPLLDQLCQSQSPAAQATFPPVRDMLQFDSLKGLWEPDDAVQDAETFEAVKPAILAEATVFVQQFQVATFARLAEAHAASTADHDPEASPSEQPSATHSDTDMATLAGKVTSSFKCPLVTCRVMKPYPDILAHWRTAHPGLFVPFLFENIGVPSGKMDDTTLQTSADYIQAIRSLLEAVEKEPSLPAATEEVTTVDDLDAIGSRFECISHRFYSNDLYVDSSPPPPPILRTWSELVDHAVKSHGNRWRTPKLPFVPPRIKIHPLPSPSPVESGSEVLASQVASDQAALAEQDTVEGQPSAAEGAQDEQVYQAQDEQVEAQVAA